MDRGFLHFSRGRTRDLLGMPSQLLICRYETLLFEAKGFPDKPCFSIHGGGTRDSGWSASLVSPL